MSKIRLDGAIREIESGKFEPKTFYSSASAKAEPSVAGHETDFGFGTAAERKEDQEESKKSYLEQRIQAEGLCHPNLFADPVKREQEWIEYLFNLRQKLSSEKS